MNTTHTGCGCGGDAVEEKKTVSIHSATVHDIVTEYPQAKEVFLKNGFDLCCNATLTIDEQAKKHGISAEKVYSELRQLVTAGA